MKYRESPSEITIFDYTPPVSEHTGRAEGERVLHSNTARSMSSLVPGFEYDIFISYRQKDNLPAGGFGQSSGYKWVTEFAAALRMELNSILKEEVTIYFDENPHDGLLESHHVDKSLEGKLRCLIFLPILSHTYCDPRSYAWSNEFLVFCKQAKEDVLGFEIRLNNGNFASRILPIQIHELDLADQRLFETTVENPLRSIEFIYKSPGVNRPLMPQDARTDNLRKTFYRDQINKTANAIAEIIKGITAHEEKTAARGEAPVSDIRYPETTLWQELSRRNVFRAAFTYLMAGMVLYQIGLFLTPALRIEERYLEVLLWIMLGGLPVAMTLAWFYELSPHGFIRTNTDLSLSNPYPPERKKPLTGRPLIVLLMLMVFMQIIYLKYYKTRPIDPVVDSMGNQRISIAVLPFENRGQGGMDAYLAAGLTDDIINRLTIIGQLRVTNHATVIKYQGNTFPSNKIAGELGVMAILTGSVQRLGKELIVRAHLIDGRSENYIWGNTFYRTAESIVEIQSEIAKVVVEKLGISLTQPEKERLNLVATGNATAYDHYLRGRSLYYRYRPASNDSAIKEFKLAIRQDPRYARAWAGLADAYSQMNTRFAMPGRWLDSSMVAASNAVGFDSTLSEAYKALANGYSNKGLYSKAFPLLKKAVQLNPLNEKAVGNLGTNYLLRNDLPNAIRWEKKAVGMDPDNWIPYQIIGWTYRLLGDLSQAESWLKKSAELDSGVYDTYEILAYTYVGQGRTEEAIRLVPRVVSIGSKDPRVLEIAGLICNMTGDTHRARNYFRESIENNEAYKEDTETVSPIALGQILMEDGKRVDAEVYLSHAMSMKLLDIEEGKENFESRFYIAAIYAIRGNKESALKWLQEAIDYGWMDHIQITHGPYFRQFKNDPAFLEKVSVLKRKAATMLAQLAKD